MVVYGYGHMGTATRRRADNEKRTKASRRFRRESNSDCICMLWLRWMNGWTEFDTHGLAWPRLGYLEVRVIANITTLFLGQPVFVFAAVPL